MALFLALALSSLIGIAAGQLTNHWDASLYGVVCFVILAVAFVRASHDVHLTESNADLIAMRDKFKSDFRRRRKEWLDERIELIAKSTAAEAELDKERSDKAGKNESSRAHTIKAIGANILAYGTVEGTWPEVEDDALHAAVNRMGVVGERLISLVENPELRAFRGPRWDDLRAQLRMAKAGRLAPQYQSATVSNEMAVFIAAYTWFFAHLYHVRAPGLRLTDLESVKALYRNGCVIIGSVVVKHGDT